MTSHLLVRNVAEMLQGGYSAGTLYPPINPFATEMLPVSDNHTLYVEQSGNQNGFPIIVLHGGPGGASSPFLRRLFDPSFYRIIAFDQRGAGQSTYTPGKQLEENLIFDLVGDIEKIRTKYGIGKWCVFGGSWGSTLAMTYAIKHPERVVALMLRGVYTGRDSEIDWFYGSFGAANLFPEMYEHFQAMPQLHPPVDGIYDGAYYVREYRRLMNGKNKRVSDEAQRRWAQLETFSDGFYVNLASTRQDGAFPKAKNLAMVENWYFLNGCGFPSKNWIFENLSHILRIPCVMVSARYDCDCPRKTAWEVFKTWELLHKKTRKGRSPELLTVPDANHVATDEKVTRALVATTDFFAFHLSGGLSGHA